MGYNLFGEFRHAVDRDLRKVETGLLIYIIGPVKCDALVASVGGDDGKSARQSRLVPGGCSAHRRPDTAVISAAALEQEAVIPVVRQRKGETDTVGSSSVLVRSLIMRSAWQWDRG